MLKMDILPFSACPVAKNKRLKKQRRRKALKISGDFPDPFSPIFL
jgi:hypothetical protein